MVMPVKIILNLMKIWSKAKFQGKWLQKTLQMPNPLYIKMFWKSKFVPEFFFWKNNIWRGIPRWCLSFVQWTTFLNMVQETTSTQLWLVIVKLPSFYECHEHSALPSPFGRNEHLKCLSHIFSLTQTTPCSRVWARSRHRWYRTRPGRLPYNSFKTHGRGQQVLDSRFQSFHLIQHILKLW